MFEYYAWIAKVEVRKGKGRKKLAIEFPCTEADVNNILEGLQQ